MQQLTNIKEVNLLENNIEEKLLKSEKDYKQGRVKKAEDIFKDWKAKYGI